MPLNNNAAKDSQYNLESANTIIQSPKPPTANNNFFP